MTTKYKDCLNFNFLKNLGNFLFYLFSLDFNRNLQRENLIKKFFILSKMQLKQKENNQVSPRIFCENVAGRTSVSEVRKQRRQQQKTEQLEKSEWPRSGGRGKNGIYVFPFFNPEMSLNRQVNPKAGTSKGITRI